jgi:nucleoside-diphosphate-sugar epimerase
VLVPTLLEAGHDVRVLDRFFFGRGDLDRASPRDRLTLIRGDVRRIDGDPFSGVDAVIDLAGLSNDPSCDLDPEVTEDVNVTGCQVVARAARRAGVRRFLYSSSCSVYGAGGDQQHTEAGPIHPVSAYARSKLEAERWLLERSSNDFSVTVLRNATVYGVSPRMRFDLVINVMTLDAWRDRKIYVVGGGQQWRPLVHLRDVCRAFLRVLESPAERVAGRVYNVGSNEQNYRVHQIAQMVRDAVPYTEVVLVPDDADRRSYQVDFSKIRDELGLEVEETPAGGIVEVKQALEQGVVRDDISTRTVDYYRYLLDAQRLIDEVAIDGRIF